MRDHLNVAVHQVKDTATRLGQFVVRVEGYLGHEGGELGCNTERWELSREYT